MTLKIQTDDLERIRAASADNIIMSVNSTVVWRIKDVKVAARLASETMSTGGRSISADITKLRKDVLKQAIASLASFIGSVNYSDSFHIAAAAQRKMASAETATQVVNTMDVNVSPTWVEPASTSVENPLFDPVGMSEAVVHANAITNAYGVEICSINIISANPEDPTLTSSLSSGAVASASALQEETTARGKAKAMKIEAEAGSITLQIKSEAEAKAALIAADTYGKSTTVKAEAEGRAEILRAEGTKKAEILRAEGSIKAASLLESSKVAVELERIKQSASALRSSDKFFFGQEPEYMSNIVMNTQSAAVLTCKSRGIKPFVEVTMVSTGTSPLTKSIRDNSKTPLTAAFNWHELNNELNTVVNENKYCSRRKAMARAAGIAAGVAAATVSQPAFAAETKEVLMGTDAGGLKFVPEKTSICKGDSVKWIINKAGPHNVVFDEDAIPSGVSQEKISMEDQLAEEGESFVMKFDTAGDYAFYCEPHRGAGMNGNLIVV